jgi:hexokinase
LLNEASDLYEKVEKVNQLIVQNNREYEAESKLQMEKLRSIEEKFVKRLEMEVLERKERENAMIQSFEQKAVHLK